MLRWSSSSASVWLWLPLSAVLARHTHWLHFSVLTLFTNTRLLRRFRRCPGRPLCGRRVAALPGRHCPVRGLLRLPLHRRAAGRSCCVSIIAGPSVIRKLARHMTFASIPSLFYERRGVHKLSRHTPQNSLRHICLASFRHEGRYFSPLHEGLALCFARHVSARFSVLPLVYRLIGNSTFGGGFCAWASALGLLRLGCWRSAWCTQSSQDTSHNFAHFLVCFRCVTPCCQCCFDFGYLGAVTRSVFVRFRA